MPLFIWLRAYKPLPQLCMIAEEKLRISGNWEFIELTEMKRKMMIKNVFVKANLGLDTVEQNEDSDKRNVCTY